MDRTYCATCGRPLPPGARFCPRCGTPTGAPSGGAGAPPAGARDAPPAGPARGTRPAPGTTPVRSGEPAPRERADTQPLALPLVTPPATGAPAGPGAPPRSARGPLLAAGLLAALALAGGVWLLGTSSQPSAPVASPSPTPSARPSGSPSPSVSPGPTLPPQERAQLVALDALLDRSSSRRGPVASAVTDLRACRVAGDRARQVFDAAAAGRRSVLGDLDGLDLGAVPQGEVLRSTLRTALQASADADSAFAAWAARQAGSCTPGADDPDLTRGLQLSAAPAGPAKEAFVSLWNRLARSAGLAPRSADAL